MSDDIRKKEVEIQILKKVFGEDVSYEECEQPDFILEYGENVKYGVEITELYYDGTSARIKNGKYVKGLLEEKKYWHKDDKKKLNVQDVSYYSKEKGYSSIQLPMLFLPKYNIHDYTKSLKKSIELKNKKLKKYCSNISKNCMLIIYDKENQFEKLSEKNIARLLFAVDLSTTVRESNYQEIYLVTRINDRSQYIPLKAYLLQSDFLLFIEFIKEHNLINKLNEIYNHPLFAFAEILKRRGNMVTFGQVNNNEVIGKIVAYCGRYGIGMVLHGDDNWGVGVFDTYPLQRIPNTEEFELESITCFFDDNLYMSYEKLVREKVASVGLFFSTEYDIANNKP